MKKLLSTLAILFFVLWTGTWLNAQSVLQPIAASKLPPCSVFTRGKTFAVVDAPSAIRCDGGGSTVNPCICNGVDWVVIGGTASVADGDKGDIVVSGTGSVWTIDSDSVALSTDTTGNYVASATTNQGLLLTGTEAASLGLIDCNAGQIIKRNVGDTGWECASDDTGSGAPTAVDYLVKTADAGLSAERVVTDTSTITWDWATAGQAKATCVDLTCTNCIGGTEINESTLGDVPTATALAANPSDCAAGKFANAIAASGNLTCDYPGTSVTDETAPYGQYDPDNPPASCAACDEFTGSTSLTWTGANQGTLSYSVVNDRLVVVGATGETTGNNLHGILTTAPAGSWTLSAKMAGVTTGNSFRGCGLMALLTGSIATPTAIATCGLVERNASQTGWNIDLTKWTNYTTIGTPDLASYWRPAIYNQDVYIQMRYDASADTIDCYYSPNGIDFLPVNAAGTNITSVTADPSDIGFLCNANDSTAGNEQISVAFFRARTDANRNDVGE